MSVHAKNKRFYIYRESIKPTSIFHQEIEDKSESSCSFSHLSSSSDSKALSIKSLNSSTKSASNSSNHSLIQLKKVQCSQKGQTSFHIHIGSRLKQRNSSSCTKEGVERQNLSDLNKSCNLSRENSNKMYSSTKIDKETNALEKKSSFHIVIKSKELANEQSSFKQQTKPKKQQSSCQNYEDDALSEDKASTNVKQRYKDVRPSDHLSTTAKQASQNEYKIAKSDIKTHSNKQPKQFANKKLKQLINGTSLFTKQSQNGKIYQQNHSDEEELFEIPKKQPIIRKKEDRCNNLYNNNSNSSNSNSNNKTWVNLQKENDDLNNKSNDRINEFKVNQYHPSSCSTMTSFTQAKKNQSDREKNSEKSSNLWNSKENSCRPYFLFDDNDKNNTTERENQIPKKKPKKNQGLKREKSSSFQEEESDFHSQKRKPKNSQRNNFTIEYDKMRFQTQSREKIKYFEFNCFRDKDLKVPDEYMNKLQEITIDDDVMTDDETLGTYIEVCFTDLLVGIEMQTKQEVDHLWDYFSPPYKSIKRRKREQEQDDNQDRDQDIESQDDDNEEDDDNENQNDDTQDQEEDDDDDIERYVDSQV